MFPGDLTRLPFTTKAELADDQETSRPWGTALTEPLERYTRYHQTSSTTDRPLCWLDTNESWAWVLDCWTAVDRAARVGTGDRVFFPFTFGPFIGFWAGFEAGVQIGAQCVPAGESSHHRLALIDALRLLDVAAQARAPAVVPTVNGTVQLEWHTRSVDAEIEAIDEVSFYLFVRPTSGVPWEGTVDEDEAVQRLEAVLV